MSDIGEMWAEHAAVRVAKKAANRQFSENMLSDKGVCFSTHNNGAHLVITGVGGAQLSSIVDFWPGTGLWIVRSTKFKRRGVHTLLAEINRLTQA